MMHKVLKFSYFLAFLLVFACGEEPKQSNNEAKNPETSPNVVDDDTTSDEKVILFFGNSLTAAYGLETEQGFPNLIQKRIDSLGLNYTVINSDLVERLPPGVSTDWIGS
ncbi:hypothetical protein [Maribacter litopenaei]|uniref:hypothetical protein n=1 Tax=Maribacter litopenaei TaxID=2976127 RepID=UPI0030840CD6